MQENFSTTGLSCDLLWLVEENCKKGKIQQIPWFLAYLNHHHHQVKASSGLSNKSACRVAVLARLAMCLQITLICHLLLLGKSWQIFSVASLANLLPCPSHPCWESNLVKYGVRHVFPRKFLQCDGVGWWSQAVLVPIHRITRKPPCCASYLHRDNTNLSWYQFSSSSIGNEFQL